MLVERENAIAQFSQATERLVDGLGGIVLVSGEAGIGKTSLLEEVKRIHQSQFVVHWSGCDPLFTPRPFGPVYDIASNLSIKISELLKTGAPPAAIFTQFYESLEATQEPLILVFEDAHWADHATFDLFKFLARRIAFVNCLLVISFRDDEVAGHLQFSSVLDILPAGQTTRIQLKPLSLEGVNQLTNSSQLDGAKLHLITAGNPFYITELLESNRAETYVPDSIKDAINSRLIRLAKAEREFLEFISLIPNSISTELINLLFGSSGETYAMACVARKLLIVDNNGEFKFRHELARLGTLKSVSVNQQKRIHSKILSALEKYDNNGDLGLLIHHAAGALDAKRVLKYAPTAAASAAQLGAHREASSYLGIALRFVDEAETELAAELYENWAYETGLTLQINEEVIEARRHAITLWRALDRKDKVGENLRWMSRLHWYRGEAAEAEHFADEAIKMLESTPASSERAMAYSLRSQYEMLNNRMDQAIEWGNRALDLETKHANTEVRIHALNNVGTAMVLRGNHLGESLLHESMALAIKHDFHEHTARVYTNFSDYCVRYKKLEMAEKLISEGIAFDTAYDLDSWTYYLVGIQSQLRLEQGRLQDAETISLGVLGLEQLTLLMQLPALTVLARAQTRLGSPDHRKYLARSLENSFATDELQYIIPARLGAIEAAWLNGEDSNAYSQLKLLCELGPTAMDHWYAGEVNEWIHRFDFDLSYKSEFDFPEPYQLELAEEYQLAAEKWLTMGLPYNAALALLQVNADEASQALPRAYKIFESLRAKAALSVLTAKARKLGLLSKLPRSKRGPYTKAKQHPLGLTAKEQLILSYIIAGTSNQDIALTLSRSKRTIENHVSSILSKLNVSNRMEVMLRVQNEPWLGNATDIDLY